MIYIAFHDILFFVGWRENKKAYSAQYHKERIKRVPLDLQRDKYDEVKSHATKQNETVNGFIKRAIDETMKRDNSTRKK